MLTALSLTIRRDISVNIACIELIDKAHRRQLSAKDKKKGNKALMRQTFMLARGTAEICGLSFLPPPRLNSWYVAHMYLRTFKELILRDSAVEKKLSALK